MKGVLFVGNGRRRGGQRPLAFSSGCRIPDTPNYFPCTLLFAASARSMLPARKQYDCTFIPLLSESRDQRRGGQRPLAFSYGCRIPDTPNYFPCTLLFAASARSTLPAQKQYDCTFIPLLSESRNQRRGGQRPLAFSSGCRIPDTPNYFPCALLFAASARSTLSARKQYDCTFIPLLSESRNQRRGGQRPLAFSSGCRIRNTPSIYPCTLLFAASARSMLPKGICSAASAPAPAPIAFLRIM